jgi:hypothetical protein
LICLFNFIQPPFHAKPRDTQFEYQQLLQPKEFQYSTRQAARSTYRHFNSSAATYVPLHIGASAEFPKLLCWLLALWSFILVPLGTTKLGGVTWRQNFFDHSLEDNHFESQTEHGPTLIFRGFAQHFLVNFKAFDIQSLITSPPDFHLDLYRTSPTLLTDEHMHPV